MKQQYHHQVVEAAFLHTKIDCYFVGTYAQRVSFSSQQYRALDLITGLQEIGKLEDAENLKIAVVGAGLAGIMAAATLRSYGASVHLFEASDDILHRQGAAVHRLIHPTLSIWPQEKPELTTNLPVFDWCAGSCDKIIENMKREWNDNYTPFIAAHDNPIGKPLKLTLNAQITDYTKNKFAPEGRLRCDGEIDWLSDLSFDMVIVATGYGLENNEAGKESISYWHKDDLLEKRQAALDNQSDNHCFYVSGCGDGGLIEALRLVHGDFLNGWLTVAAAEELYGTGIAEDIKKAEQRALMWSRSILAFEPQNVAAAYGDSVLAAHLEMVYTNAADRLRSPPPDDPDYDKYQAVHQFLTHSLNKIKLNGRVFLVSPLDGPFGPNSAPIHKLLVAHALKANRLEYRKGHYRSDESGSWIESGFERVTSGKCSTLIPRHGPETARTNIIDSREQQSLRLRQIMLADRLEINTARILPGGGQDKNLGIRLPHVRAMIHEMDNRFVVDATPKAYIFKQAVARDTPDSGCAASISNYDPLKTNLTLFGNIPLQRSDEGLDVYEI